MLLCEPPASLDPPTTTVEQPPRELPAQLIVHQQTRQTRNLWLKALPRLYLPTRIDNRFRLCGMKSWIEWSPSEKRYRLLISGCNLRWCPHCAPRLNRRWSRNIEAMMNGAGKHDYKLITLTTRHSDTPLSDQVSDLKKLFRRLRQRKLWLRHVTHGIAVIEITYNQKEKRWHPHLHVICKSSYIEQGHLSQAWLSITGDSQICDIREVKTARGAAGYVAKYVAKAPPNGTIANIELAKEWLETVTKTRLFIRFGKPKTPIDPDPSDKDHGDWYRMLGLNDLLASAREGFAPAREILKALFNRRTHTPAHCYRHSHHETDKTDFYEIWFGDSS